MIQKWSFGQISASIVMLYIVGRQIRPWLQFFQKKIDFLIFGWKMAEKDPRNFENFQFYLGHSYDVVGPEIRLSLQNCENFVEETLNWSKKGLEGPKFEILGILDRADDPKMVEFFFSLFSTQNHPIREKNDKKVFVHFCPMWPLGLSHFKAENC